MNMYTRSKFKKTGFIVLLFAACLLLFLQIKTVSADLENANSFTEDNFKLTESDYKYLSELEIPENTSSFYLDGKNVENESALRITFNNGEIVENHVHIAELGRDEGIESISELSTPFSYNREIKKVEYFSNQNKGLDIEVKKINTSSLEALNLITAQSITSSSAISRRNFFSNLGLNIQLREDWGVPGTNPWVPYYPDSLSKIVVHHTASNINTNDPSQAVRDIYEFHKNRCAYVGGSYDPNNPDCDEQGELWEDIGYNYLIDQNGTIYEGRAGGNGVTGAHSPPNYGTIGIAFIGNYEDSIPSGAARNSFTSLVARLSAFNGIDPVWGVSVVGHNDRNATVCPGASFYNVLGGLTSEANTLINLIPELEQISLESNNLTVGREAELVNVSANEIEMVVSISSVSTSTLEWLENEAPTTSEFRNYGDYLIFSIDKLYAKKIVSEVKALNTGAIIQPTFKKEIAGWSGTTPDDYDSSSQFHADLINMEDTWAEASCPGGSRCGGSSSVVVAVIDTGVAYEDYDFDAGTNFTSRKFSSDPNYFNIEVPGIADTPDGEFNEGYDRAYAVAPELTNTTFTDPYDFAWDFMCFERSGTLYECNTAELEKRNHANDDDGHGTFVSTIIAGNTGDAATSGVVGVAHNVQIMPIKAFFPNDSSMCYDSNYDNDPDCLGSNKDYSLRGVSFSYLLAQSINYAVNNGADVINMSLSGGGTDPVLQNAIDNAVNNGVVVIAASGNNGANVANYFPGGMENVISVGASTPSDSRASYSNYGSKLDIVAPVGNGIPSQWYSCSSSDTCWEESGGDLLSAHSSSLLPDTAAGTSFAAPQVAGAAALLISKYPSITPAQIELTLKQNARDVGTAGKDDQTGYGVLDISKSLSNKVEGATELANYRFYNTDSGAHFYTVSAVERNSVQQNLSQYIYEGENYKVWDSESDSYSPVYRFYNTDTGAHFYTSSTVERNSVQANLPQYIYEGISYYISATQIAGSVPLYRFYNVDSGAHFYTNSKVERDSVQANLPQYIYEGVAYYVLPK